MNNRKTAYIGYWKKLHGFPGNTVESHGAFLLLQFKNYDVFLFLLMQPESHGVFLLIQLKAECFSNSPVQCQMNTENSTCHIYRKGKSSFAYIFSDLGFPGTYITKKSLAMLKCFSSYVAKISLRYIDHVQNRCYK